MKTLKEISGKAESSIPDLLLIAHDYQNIDPSSIFQKFHIK